MNKLYLFTRNSAFKSKFLHPLSCTHQEFAAFKSNDGGDSQDSPPNSKKEEAANKLNDLLKRMMQDDTKAPETKLNLAKPSNKREKFAKKKVDPAKKVSSEKEIVKAVKEVAQTVPGDAKVTESELLSKLLSPATEKPEASVNLSDIVKGMQIDRETKPNDRQTRAEQVKMLLQRFKQQDRNVVQSNARPRRAPITRKTPEQVTEKIDLFGSEPLGIFTNKDTLQDGVENKTWQDLQNRELKLAVTNPPANYFEQMILWTEQGKIWNFPIDNEQGLEKEGEVYFAEHVFLEKHLEPWCPHKGPIRHFMELVCVGLSKNPYITVEAKKEHIEWYKNYFEDKKKLLQEVGAIPVQSQEQQLNKD